MFNLEGFARLSRPGVIGSLEPVFASRYEADHPRNHA